MSWNWQHTNWPEFIYSPDKLESYEKEFLYKAGIFLGSLKHVADEDRDALKVDLISDEAFKTSEIEGEALNRDSLQSSIRGHFGLKADNRRASPAEHGISEMMVDLYKTYQTPLAHDRLFEWHRMLTNGRRDLCNIGAYRAHEDPMQVVSGAMGNLQFTMRRPPHQGFPMK